MSIRDINQRWLASEGLDDASIAILNAARATFVSMPPGHEITGCPRPPWWRVFTRRRWDRTVELGRRLYCETASRMGALVGPEGDATCSQER